MRRSWVKSFKQFESPGYNPKMISESTTFKDVERFLHQSYRDNPTDDDAELAERAIMNPDFADVADQMEREEWPFDIAMEILAGNFY